MQRIKSVGVLSVAKMSGVFFGVLGLLLFPYFWLFASASSAVAYAFAAPIIYGGLGFIAGAVEAYVYNQVAGFVGGIEVKLETVAVPVTTPTPENP